MLKKMPLLCLMALMCLLAALPALAEFDVSQAGLTVSGQAQQLGDPKDYGSAKITVPVPADNPAQDGVNPITGESYSGSYQPVLVNIDSHPRALPHWGVASADLIYELPIQQDGSTRQLALFMSEYPEMAGPVRSARIPMASLREMWGAPYYFFGYQGGTTSVKDWVKKYSENRKFSYPYVELMNKKLGQWYNRTNDGNHVAPYNVTLVMDKVREEYNVSPEAQPFLFDETGLTRGEDAPGVIISYKATSPAYLTAYQYDETTGLYDRYRNGEPYTDAITGEATSFANVIVVRTDVSFANNNPSRPVIRLNGQGVCEIFQNGRYIRGTWVRESTETKNLDSRMIFLDENGNELPMKVGKTFIQIVDNEQPVIVVSEARISGSVEPEEQRLIIGDGKSAATTTQKKKPKATATPTPEPTETPTPEPTATPTPEPTETSTPVPTQTPTPTPEATQPEQSEPEQSEPEQDKPEESAPEQTEPEQSEPEQDKPEESAPEQTEPEQSVTEQDKPEENAPEQTEPEQSEPEQGKSEESAPEQTEPEQSAPEQSEPEQAQPEQIQTEQAPASEPEPAPQPEPQPEPAPDAAAESDASAEHADAGSEE